MEAYETVTQAINGLRKQGYTQDFNLKEDCLECNELQLHPDDFAVDKFFRFEGDSNPDDEAIVYAISSGKYHVKGVLVNAFGLYSDAAANELMRKLKVH